MATKDVYTVKDLREALSSLPLDTPVFLYRGQGIYYDGVQLNMEELGANCTVGEYSHEHHDHSFMGLTFSEAPSKGVEY